MALVIRTFEFFAKVFWPRFQNSFIFYLESSLITLYSGHSKKEDFLLFDPYGK